MSRIAHDSRSPQLFIMISIHEQDKRQVSPSSPNFRFEFLDWYAIMGRVPSTSAAQLEDRWGRYAGVVGVPYTSISEMYGLICVDPICTNSF